jgi:cell pole-organizing protein PopZ
MAESPKDPDQSMEDILQSIKRIIADEAEPAPAMPGSDVLELTELLEEDVAVPSAQAEDEPAVAVSPMSLDDIMAAPMDSFVQPEPESEPEIEIPSEPESFEAAAVESVAPTMAAEPSVLAGGDRLMSDATLAASVAALHALSHSPQPLPAGGFAFRSGTTVEDLVIEAMKPMLKDWLDSNLPAMVRSLVEKEIRRLSN